MLEKNKENCICIMASLLSRQRNDPFLMNIITSDEKWVFYDNVQCKKQWIDKNIYPQTTPKAELHRIKVMLVGSLQYYSFWVFKLQSDTQCKLIFLTDATSTRKSPKKQPTLINMRNIVLLHDNARPYSSKHHPRKKILDLDWSVLSIHHIHQTLPPSDFLLFHSLWKISFLKKIRQKHSGKIDHKTSWILYIHIQNTMWECVLYIYIYIYIYWPAHWHKG